MAARVGGGNIRRLFLREDGHVGCSKWLSSCIEDEMSSNVGGEHESCSCRCPRCYRLTWLRVPKCECKHRQSRRWMSIDEMVRHRRRACRCDPSGSVKWSAWYCEGCLPRCSDHPSEESECLSDGDLDSSTGGCNTAYPVEGETNAVSEDSKGISEESDSISEEAYYSP